MRRSLKTWVQNTEIIGDKLVTETRPGRFRVEGPTVPTYHVHEDGTRKGRYQARPKTSDASAKRPKFFALNLPEAMQKAEELLFGILPKPSHETTRISEMFGAWEKTRSCKSKTLSEYQLANELFTTWCDSKGLHYWNDLQPAHLQMYVKTLREDPIWSKEKGRTEPYGYEYVRRIFFSVKSTAKFASENSHGRFFDIGKGVKIPKDTKNRTLRKRNPAISFDEVCQFLFWLDEKEKGWCVLPGVALQGLCGLRVTEAWRLTWDRVDLKAGTIEISGETKNDPSVRLIPVPALVLDILAETRERVQGERVIAFYRRRKNQNDYSKKVKRQLLEWRSDCAIRVTKDLRNTLEAEADRLDFLGATVERYLGHDPKDVSRVSILHYLPNDPDEQAEFMRKRIIPKIDLALLERRKEWSARAGTNVVPLQLAAQAG